MVTYRRLSSLSHEQEICWQVSGVGNFCVVCVCGVCVCVCVCVSPVHFIRLFDVWLVHF